MPVCMVLVELAITCVHDYMVVTVTVTKIYGKMNLNRWASHLQLYQQLSYHDFRQLVTHECCNIYIYIYIRRELGGTGTGCLFQLTYCVVWNY